MNTHPAGETDGIPNANVQAADDADYHEMPGLVGEEEMNTDDESDDRLSANGQADANDEAELTDQPRTEIDGESCESLPRTDRTEGSDLDTDHRESKGVSSILHIFANV